ncbi:hypothetical protein P3G55_02220 [Leptospira sp. 96542]|nr:hypothetical protein [Leptospira sp. 96542]
MKYQILLIPVLLFCCKVSPSILKKERVGHVCPLASERGTVYGSYLTQVDLQKIEKIIVDLLSDICNSEWKHLALYTNESMGLFVDAKGHWSKNEVLNDIKNPDGYFQIYYFDSEKLDKKKGTLGNLTVQDAFFSTEMIGFDIYALSTKEAEVRFVFKTNEKNARYLINPSFVKIDNEWYLLRMF